MFLLVSSSLNLLIFVSGRELCSLVTFATWQTQSMKTTTGKTDTINMAVGFYLVSVSSP